MFRSQPGTYHIQNTFLPLSDENVQATFECQEECCNCCIDQYSYHFTC